MAPMADKSKMGSNKGPFSPAPVQKGPGSADHGGTEMSSDNSGSGRDAAKGAE